MRDESKIPDFDWKEDGVEGELRRLHDDGHSAQKISYKLTQKFGGMLTRSAVLGKINRLGLSVHSPGTVWSEDKIAELKRLHGEGLYPSHIADELTRKFGVRVTYSAVCHKINRLGLSVKPGPKPQLGNPPRQEFAAPILDTDIAPAIDLSADEIPMSQRKQLLDLDVGECRFPYGDVGHPDFFFCGAHAEEGRPYCVFHCRMAYAPRRNVSDHGRLVHSATCRKNNDPMGILRTDKILDADAA